MKVYNNLCARLFHKYLITVQTDFIKKLFVVQSNLKFCFISNVENNFEICPINILIHINFIDIHFDGVVLNIESNDLYK